ncbi:MAG: hypothetical protein QW303_07040 [Nitrososphaerota archaeon]
MLVLFNKQLVNGVYLQARPEVYELSGGRFLVEYKGKQFVGDDLLDQSHTHIDVNELKQLQYIGSTEDISFGWVYHFYLGDKEQRVVVRESDGKELSYIECIGCEKIQGVEIFADQDVYIRGDYCFTKFSGKYIVVNINTGETISIRDVDFVSKEYIKQAIGNNRLEFLKKLADMRYNGIYHLGQYNLEQISPSKVSIEDLWQEAQKVEVKEMLFTGYSRAVYHLVKALKYKDQVEGWGEKFGKYRVKVYKGDVVIYRDYNSIATFSDKLKWWWRSEERLEQDDHMVYNLCHRYSLCNSQLGKTGLKEWAGFLKSCKVEGI